MNEGSMKKTQAGSPPIWHSPVTTASTSPTVRGVGELFIVAGKPMGSPPCRRGPHLLKGALVAEQFHATACADAEVVAALGADAGVFAQFVRRAHGLADRAGGVQLLGDLRALGLRVARVFQFDARAAEEGFW